MPNVSLVIAEYGSNWLPWARKLRGDKDQVVVLVQDSEEAPAAFAHRVLDRMRRLRKDGMQVVEAAVVGSEACTSAHKHQRTKILRKLTAMLSSSGNAAHLYLDPCAAEHRPSHHLMRALAWALTDMTRGSGLSISVHAAADLAA